MLLRPRQIEFVEKSVAALKEHGNTVSVAFTGAGKTICLSAVIKKLASEKANLKTLVIAHRDEITYQNQDKFSRVASNISTSLFNGDTKDWSGQTVFGMIQVSQ
jgi:DNA repair protein RadD